MSSMISRGGGHRVRASVCSRQVVDNASTMSLVLLGQPQVEGSNPSWGLWRDGVIGITCTRV